MDSSLYGVTPRATNSVLAFLLFLPPSPLPLRTDSNLPRYETYLIPGETLIPGEGAKGEAFHPGTGYASTPKFTPMARKFQNFTNSNY